MCGIYGLISVKGPAPKDEDWRKLLAALGALSCVRGTDSAGLARADKYGICDIVKDAVPAWELVRNPRWQEVARPGTFAIGHTRFATHGTVCQRNAHPFAFRADDSSETCAVHNGMISNHQELVGKGGVISEVDSANLIAALAGEDIDTYKSVLRKTKGTLALAIVRKPPRGNGRLILTRSGNPLYMCRVANLQALAFASTEDILKKALAACHLTAMGGIWQLKEGVLYVYDGRSAKPRKIRWRKKHSHTATDKRILQYYVDQYAKKDTRGIVDWQSCGACLHSFRSDELAVERGVKMCPECVFASQHAFSGRHHLLGKGA